MSEANTEDLRPLSHSGVGGGNANKSDRTGGEACKRVSSVNGQATGGSSAGDTIPGTPIAQPAPIPLEAQALPVDVDLGPLGVGAASEKAFLPELATRSGVVSVDPDAAQAPPNLSSIPASDCIDESVGLRDCLGAPRTAPTRSHSRARAGIRKSPRRGGPGHGGGRAGGHPGKQAAQGGAGRRARGGGRGGKGGHLNVDGLISGPVLRHSKTLFSYGNYDAYYSQRYDRFAAPDPRVEALSSAHGDFFRGRAVLDVGCGSGFLTMLVAEMGATRAVGVDIDATLVGQALKQLRRVKSQGQAAIPKAPSGTAVRFPISFVQCRGIIPYNAKPLNVSTVAGQLLKPQTQEDRSLGGDWPVFPYNVEFRTENFLVSEVEERRAMPYGVVLCLRLTKWVHLNWGDAGVKVLFHRCFQRLIPGGTLVLEAQDWQSYQERTHLTPHMKEQRANIRLRPQEFVTYLVHVVGFESPETVGKCPPLKRPLLLLRRPPGSTLRIASVGSVRGEGVASTPSGTTSDSVGYPEDVGFMTMHHPETCAPRVESSSKAERGESPAREVLLNAPAPSTTFESGLATLAQGPPFSEAASSLAAEDSWAPVSEAGRTNPLREAGAVGVKRRAAQPAEDVSVSAAHETQKGAAGQHDVALADCVAVFEPPAAKRARASQ